MPDRKNTNSFDLSPARSTLVFKREFDAEPTVKIQVDTATVQRGCPEEGHLVPVDRDVVMLERAGEVDLRDSPLYQGCCSKRWMPKSVARPGLGS
jgi:hypothetical protein